MIHPATDIDLKASLDSDCHSAVSYIYNSFDLYSQLYDDSGWSGQNPDTTDSSRKDTTSQLKYNVRSKRKAIIENSHASADKFNISKGLSEDKAEQRHVTKHGLIWEATPNLHVVAEETESDTKTLSSSNAGNTSYTQEKSFSSLHEPGVMKLIYCIFLSILVVFLMDYAIHFQKFTKKREKNTKLIFLRNNATVILRA
jgi:eukaryotic translation initiation factor 2-alpha kinase 4